MDAICYEGPKDAKRHSPKAKLEENCELRETGNVCEQIRAQLNLFKKWRLFIV